MLGKFKNLFSKKDRSAEEEERKEEQTTQPMEEETQPQETAQQREEITPEEEKSSRPLLPHELETFKKGMGITPHNYWTWASRTNNFKLLTDGEYVWVEGHEDHIGKQLPLTQQKAWSWDFIRKRLQDFGGEG